MDINILLFSKFETLDVFGPVEILGRMDESNLHFASLNGGIVKSSQGVEIMTKTLDSIDFSKTLLIPGGEGTRYLVNDNYFIDKLNDMVIQAEYCLTICTGSALLAKTDLLNGCRATSNKRAFAWVKSLNSQINWINHARWVMDGKFYTSSGVSAGIDMTLGFIADKFSREKAEAIAQSIEYVWNADMNNDLFAVHE